MSVDFQSLKNFDFDNSNPLLWVFKDSATPSRFRAFYVQTEGELNAKFDVATVFRTYF